MTTVGQSLQPAINQDQELAGWKACPTGPNAYDAKRISCLTMAIFAFTIATLALQSPGGTTVSSLVGAIPFVTSVGLLFCAHHCG
jgi:hypothetical protein